MSDSEGRWRHIVPRRILAVKLSSFGDIVHVTPCLRALRQAFPRTELVVAVERRWAGVLANNPHIDGVLESSSCDRLSTSYLWEVCRTLSRFVKTGGLFDLALDFQGNHRSAAWVYLSRAAVKVGRGGVRPGWHRSVLPDPAQHAVAVCAEVCRRAGVTVEDLSPEVFPAEADERRLDVVLARNLLPLSGFILLNPFSRWNSKSWPISMAAALMIRLRRELGVTVVVTGGPEDSEKAAELLRTSPAVSLAGCLTLGESFCLYRRARLMISCDSGPMHASAAVGTPVVALFGPTLPERTGPWGEGHIVLQALRPPGHHEYRRDHRGGYMRALASDTVFGAVRAVLTRLPVSHESGTRR